MAEAEIYVCENRASEGSARYYRRLERRYAGDGRSAADGRPRATPVVCVNLLRTQPGKPELVRMRFLFLLSTTSSTAWVDECTSQLL
jgi:hypothetical protein